MCAVPGAVVVAVVSRVRWRNIRKADGYRVASRGGPVRSLDRTLTDGREFGGGELAQYRDRDGYWHVTISGEPVAVATLVLEAFDRPRPYGLEACHGLLGQDCNCAGNLRWDTHRENERDKRRKGKSESEGGTCPFCVRTLGHREVQC